MTMPMGPMMMSASRLLTITGFSPVAPASAPAFSMAEVAMPLVPTAMSFNSGWVFFSCSTTHFPIFPPCPSMIMIFICKTPSLCF